MNDDLYHNLARLTDLEVRLYRLQTKSHLRIGAGEGTADVSAAENPIIRALIYREDEEKPVRVPYLPGSSLHGVMRAWVEKALRSREEPLSREQVSALFDEEQGVAQLRENVAGELAAFLGKENGSDVTDDELVRYWQVYAEVCNPLWNSDQCERISRRDWEKRRWKQEYVERIGRDVPCRACSIFGYAGQRGRVKVTPAFPAAPLADALPVDIITRVAINRLTGAADEGKLFDLEAIPPGVDFYFFVVMENMTHEQKQDFQKGIRAMNLQLAGVGAHGTIGFGMVDVSEVYRAKLEPSIFDLELEELLTDFWTDGNYRLRAALDREKYPDFFLALSALDAGGRTPAAFEGYVDFQTVGDGNGHGV